MKHLLVVGPVEQSDLPDVISQLTQLGVDVQSVERNSTHSNAAKLRRTAKQSRSPASKKSGITRTRITLAQAQKVAKARGSAEHVADKYGISTQTVYRIRNREGRFHELG